MVILVSMLPKTVATLNHRISCIKKRSLPGKFRHSISVQSDRVSVPYTSSIVSLEYFRNVSQCKINQVAVKVAGDDILGVGEDFEEDDDLCPVECVKEFRTDEEFIKILEKSKKTKALVIVDFFRTSCGSCKYIEKGFSKLCKGSGQEGAPIIFLKHNVIDEYDEQSEVAERLRIKKSHGLGICCALRKRMLSMSPNEQSIGMVELSKSEQETSKQHKRVFTWFGNVPTSTGLHYVVISITTYKAHFDL